MGFMGIINRKVDPNRNMQRQHPFDVWRALVALQMRDMMIDEKENLFYPPEMIAKVLYVNFDDLRPHDQHRVIERKLIWALKCLCYSVHAEEDKTRRMIPDRYGGPPEVTYEHKNVFRARHIFNIPGWRRSTMLEATKESIDRQWGLYLGRAGAVDAFIHRWR